MIQWEKLRLHISSKHKEVTISHKRMHQKHIKNLKSLLNNYNVDHFEDSSTICINTGREIHFSVVRGLLQAPELVNETYLNLMTKRLIEEEKNQSQILTH